MWALKSAPQLATFWCIRAQFAENIALSTTNAGVRREEIGFPTNARVNAFLSGEPERYRGDRVCMVDWREVEKTLKLASTRDQINIVAYCQLELKKKKKSILPAMLVSKPQLWLR